MAAELAYQVAEAMVSARGAETEYERGRRSVRRELAVAVQKFNDDDSLGIGQLIEVISPWLLEDRNPPAAGQS